MHLIFQIVGLVLKFVFISRENGIITQETEESPDGVTEMSLSFITMWSARSSLV